MHSLQEATKLIEEESQKWNCEEKWILLEEAISHVLSEDLVATSPHPSFSKSAMDGYVISEEGDTFTIAGEIAAGDSREVQISKGQCYRIFTGAKVPLNSTRVVRQEFCESNNGVLRILREDQSNVLRLGEDFQKGEVIVSKGTALHSAHIGLAAGQGIEKLRVFEKASVGILSSGEELVPVSSIPGDSQIRNSNSPMLLSSLKHWNHPCKDWGITGDNQEELVEVLHEALGEHDVVILSGGASKGKYDLVKPACRALGVEFLIEGVRLRPGKPFSYGSFGSKGVFVLPGNPVAAYLTYLALVQPFLEARNSLNTTPIPAVASFQNKKTDFSCLIPARWKPGLGIEPVEFHGSGHIHALANADYCALIPENCEEVKAGEIVQAIPIR